MTILREYFKLPFQVEQFVGHWMRLPGEVQSRIGFQEDGNRLGSSLMLGRSVWDCQHKFRIVIGPVDYADYQRFMPGGESMERLLAWVKTYVGVTLDWDVRLVLKKEHMPPLRLGGATRMGWSTWLSSTAPQRDLDQMVMNQSCIESSAT